MTHIYLSISSLNVTISIVLQLGDAIAGVASGLADTDVSALSDFGGGVALVSCSQRPQQFDVTG